MDPRSSVSSLVLLLAIVQLLPLPCKIVTLSNTVLPKDTNGNPLRTGEATILPYGDRFFVYFNVWGGCPGLDCCTMGDCATCCFNPPSPRFNDTCVYTNNHTVVVYETLDFETWVYRGEALPMEERRVGVEFRPQVVFSPLLGKFVMWYEDRWVGQKGYAVALADSPVGPFKTVAETVVMSGGGRIGDYDLFVDDDGTAYHVRTGLTIEKLSPTFTAGSGQFIDIPNNDVEAPVLFKSNQTYYLLVGSSCCACRGGASVIVYTATHPMGPYQKGADIGSNTTDGHVFQPASPYNYITHSQQSKVVPVLDKNTGKTQYLWLGNQWVTALLPDGSLGGPRDEDLLYWTLLDFDNNGAIKQILYQDSIQINL